MIYSKAMWNLSNEDDRSVLLWRLVSDYPDWMLKEMLQLLYRALRTAETVDDTVVNELMFLLHAAQDRHNRPPLR